MSDRDGKRGRGRDGGHNSGRSGPLPRNVQVSKKIAWLLRHGAEKEGLHLDARGFVNVHEMLQNRNLKSLRVTFEEVKACVRDNDKQRFTLVSVAAIDGRTMSSSPPPPPLLPSSITSSSSPPPSPPSPSPPSPSSSPSSENPRDYLIRANQGHSLKVANDTLLQPITKENMPAQAIHGTTHAAYGSIVASGGLKPMGRNHVHFAAGLPPGFKSMVEDESQPPDVESAPVISGMRKSSTILIFLDLPKAIEAGIQFWRSDNGVILSEGDDDGVLPLAFFKRVEDRTGTGVLVDDGRVLKNAPAKWAMKGVARATTLDASHELAHRLPNPE